MKIGYTTWGMPKVSIDQALEYLAGLGFDAVEPAVIPGFTTELDTLEAGERQRIRDLFDGYGLHMPAVAGHLSLMERDPRAHAENWRRLQGEVELCAEWARGEDAPTLDTVVGGRPQDWEGARDLIVERTRALAEYAAGWGVIVSLEPHIGNALETPEQAAWLIEEIDSPYLRLNFDISHFDILGLDMAQTVARLAPYAAHTHVKDQRGRAPDFEFLIPGEGEFDFVAYLREMDKAGYTGSITAEVSFMVQKRPDYDPFAAAELCYRTLERAFARSGVARD